MQICSRGTREEVLANPNAHEILANPKMPVHHGTNRTIIISQHDQKQKKEEKPITSALPEEEDQVRVLAEVTDLSHFSPMLKISAILAACLLATAGSAAAAAGPT